MFGDLGGIGALLKKAQEMGGKMNAMAGELRSRRTTGSAGGGMVEIEVNGLVEVLRCHIDPQLFAQGDRELLEDMVMAAANQAISKAKQLHAESLKSLTGGLPIPGLEQAMAKFFPGDATEPS